MISLKYIHYTAGYKYQLEEDYEHDIVFGSIVSGGNRFVQITVGGKLLVRAGYAWDGPSGPAIDTPNFMRGSLVHDALYQLMRLGVLNKEDHRKFADQLLREICIEDGMSSIRAWWVYQAVRAFGGQYMRSVKEEIFTAPR